MSARRRPSSSIALSRARSSATPHCSATPTTTARMSGTSQPGCREPAMSAPTTAPWAPRRGTASADARGEPCASVSDVSTTRPVRIASSATACAASTSSAGPTAASVSTASPRRMRTAATSIPAPARSATVEAATSCGPAAAARCEALRSSSSERSRAARSASWACRRRRSEEARDSVNAPSMTARIAPPARMASDEECEAPLPLAVTTQRRPPSVERPRAPARRWCLRRVHLRAVDAQANPELGRQALEHVGDHARAEPGADVADGSLATPGRRVDRPKRLEAAAAGDERDQAGEGGAASRAGSRQRRSAGRLAHQVEPDQSAPRTSFRPDRDDRDVRGPLAGGSEHTGRAPARRCACLASPRTAPAGRRSRSRPAQGRRSPRSTPRPARMRRSSHRLPHPARPRGPPRPEGSSRRDRGCSAAPRSRSAPRDRPRRASCRPPASTGATPRRRSRSRPARRATRRRAWARRRESSRTG